MFRSNILRITLAIAILFILPLTGQTQPQSKLVVAIDKSYAPFTLVTPTGEPAGVLIEMWQLWSKQTGIEVEFAPGTWEESLALLKSGQADVHSGLFKNSTRAEWFAFSGALHSIKSALYHRSRSKAPSFDTLKESRVGAVADTYQFDYLQDNNPNISVVPYTNHKALLTGLLAGEIDVLFDEVPSVSRNLAQLGWEGLVSRVHESEINNTVHAATSKARIDTIKRIDDGFRNLNPVLLAAIDKRWIVNPDDRYYKDVTEGVEVDLTDKEKAFLNENKSISLTSTPNWPPFEMEQADGSYAGIAADFIRVAAGKVGLDIEPMFDTNWGAHMDKLKAGELDVAPGLNETAKRLEHFTFTKPYIEYYSAIFTKTDRKDITTPEDLAGMTVALEEGYAIARNLPTDRPDIKMILVKTTQDALEAVSTGKADAYIGNQVVASYLIKKFTLPNLKLVSLWRTDLPGQLRFAVNKDNPLLRDILQKGLDAITKEEREAILSTYLDSSGFQQKVFSLTQEQWDWLKAHPDISLGIDPQSAPFEFIKDSGEYQGIASEYVSFIKNKLKVDMTLVDGLSWKDVLRYAELGRLDVISSIARTPAREEYLLFTEPYIEFPIVIFSPKQAPLITALSDIAGGRVAVVEGYAAHDYLSADYPEIAPALFASVNEALNALKLGEVDWFINDLATGSYAIEHKGITNLKIAASTDYTLAISMAVRKDLPELVEILNKALSVVSDEQAAKFKGKWLALKFEHGLDIATVLTWVLPISGGVLLIIGFIVLWNRKLGKEIADRKAAEQALSVSEVKYRELVENANSMILKLDIKGRISFFNEFAQSFFGYSAEEIEGQPILGTIVADEEGNGEQDFSIFIDELIKNPDRHKTNENENICKDGRKAWVSWSNQAIFDEQGEFIELLCIGADITERRKAEQERDDALNVITSSIQYASRIQRSILPNTQLFTELVPDHFVLWQPRDVVGGDIYWNVPWGDGVLVMLGDCTGHGVPGAFITLLSTGAFERALIEVDLGDSAALLKRMNQLIKTTLCQDESHDSTDGSDDGLELGICFVHPQRDSITYAGARFELFIKNNGTVDMIKGDKKGIGYRNIPSDSTYTNKEVAVEPGMTFYMTTDGIIDQVGGKKRLGFGKKRFKRFLLTLDDSKLHNQGELIYQKLIEYQGPEKRRDDIAAIGFKLASS